MSNSFLFPIVVENPMKILPSFVTEEKELVKEFLSILKREEFSKEKLQEYNFIPTQSILFKRSLYKEYGGFDEELENLEDWELWKKYSQEYKFKFINKTTSLYRLLTYKTL